MVRDTKSVHGESPEMLSKVIDQKTSIVREIVCRNEIFSLSSGGEDLADVETMKIKLSKLSANQVYDGFRGKRHKGCPW